MRPSHRWKSSKDWAHLFANWNTGPEETRVDAVLCCSSSVWQCLLLESCVAAYPLVCVCVGGGCCSLWGMGWVSRGPDSGLCSGCFLFVIPFVSPQIYLKFMRSPHRQTWRLSFHLAFQGVYSVSSHLSTTCSEPWAVNEVGWRCIFEAFGLVVNGHSYDIVLG